MRKYNIYSKKLHKNIEKFFKSRMERFKEIIIYNKISMKLWKQKIKHFKTIME